MENPTVSVRAAVEEIVAIPSNEMAGAIVVNAFAILSTLALFSIFLRVLWLGVLRFLGESVAQSLFNTQLGYYAACLLIANMISAIAGLMGLPFLLNHAITDNAICTSQAAVMQVGNIATAYFTVAIAIHTFNSLVLRKRQSIRVYGPTIIFGWAVSLAVAFIPLIPRMGPVYGPSGLACGVRPTFPWHLFFFHLLPIFVAAVLSGILYTLIFLVLRGSKGLRITKDHSNSSYQQFVANIAQSMLWYPAAYILLLVPYSITRSLGIAGAVIPFQVMVFAFVCWFTLGVVNALLLFNTFRILSIAFEARPITGYKPGDLESFGTAETFKRFTTDLKGPLHLNLTDTMIKEYRGTDASISSSSSYYPSTTVPERAMSAQGSYRSVTPNDVSRQISPVSTLNQSIVVEAPGSMIAARPPVGVIHQPRQASSSSITSLPVPPRRTPTPTPLILDHSSNPSMDSFTSTSSPIARPAVAQPSLTPRNVSSPANDQMRFSRASTASSASGDLDISGWMSTQNSDGSMPSSATRNQPMLSAVKPNFPTSLPPSDPTATAAARLRPLLLASVERTGSMVLAERYNRMYMNSPNESLKSTKEEDM
jgi:hypothetical protein